MVAFIAGWGLYRYGNVFTQYEKEPDKIDVTTPEAPISKGAVQTGSGLGQMVRILNLSPEQISQFSEIEGQYREKLNCYLAQLDTIDLEILNEIKKEKPNIKQLDSLSRRSGELQYALKKETGEHFIQIKSICTPEQQKEFVKVISEIGRYRQGQGRGEGRGLGRGQKRGWRNRNQ